MSTGLVQFLGWPMALIALLVFLLNIKSMPFGYHIRSALILYKWKKQRKQHILDKDNLWKPLTLNFRLFPDDLDINIHMNNSSYNKHMDFARLDWISFAFGSNYLANTKVANGGVMCWFKKEIKPWTRFQIETRLLTFDQKWFILEHRFVSHPRPNEKVVHCIGLSKLVLKQKNGKTIPFQEALQQAAWIPADASPAKQRQLETKRATQWTKVAGIFASEEALFNEE